MAQQFPLNLDPVHLARQDAIVEGAIALNRLPRFVADVASAVDHPFAVLRFVQAPGGHIQVTGQLQGQAQLTCQRCLEPFDWQFDLQVSYIVVTSEAAAERMADAQSEVLLFDDSDPWDFAEVLEDELLLYIPQIPRHDDGACDETLLSSYLTSEEDKQRDNPFSVLRGINRDAAN